MEESTQRRDRLKAMRMEAAETEVSHNVNTSIPTGNLTNPLLECSSVPEKSPASRRFDFYTDPMAAFSGNKRTTRDTYQNPQSSMTSVNFTTPNIGPLPYPSGPRNLNPSLPSNQLQGVHEAQSPYLSSEPWRSPAGIATPFPVHQGTLPEAWNRPGGPAGYDFSPNSSNPAGFSSHGFGGGGSHRPYFGRGPSSSPGFGRGGSSSPNPYSNRGPNPRPGFGGGGGPNPHYRRAPNPSFGREINYSHYGRSPSPSSGRGGGRGRGLPTCVSARERPEQFYNKSMVEDPWVSLKPIVRYWFPKSISTKKPRTSGSTFKFNSQSSGSSLAEYLAASLEEATE